MAKNISLLGADYPDVPAVVLPKTGGGSAMFVDADDVEKKILTATSASTTISANSCAVVEYEFNVPSGYKIIAAYDDSYYANTIASVIRIRTDSNNYKVVFNYFVTSGVSGRKYTAKAVAVPASTVTYV